MPVPNRNRRKLLKAVGVLGTAGLAGCSTQDAGGETIPGDGTTGNETTAGTTEANATTDRESTDDLQGGQVGGTFLRGSTAEARSPMPLRLGDTSTEYRIYLLFEGGHEINENEEFEPLWFEEFDLNEEGTELRLKLRDDLQYGDPYGQMTTEDWLYNLEHVWQVPPSQNWTGFQYTSKFFETVDGESKPIDVQAVDDLTLRVTLDRPRPEYLYSNPYAYVLPIPKGLLEKYVPKEGASSQQRKAAYEELRGDAEFAHGKFNGNLGPYSFVSWQQNSKMVLERNDDYYRRGDEEWLQDAPYFEQYVFQIFEENTTARNALKNGSINYTNVDPLKASSIESADNANLHVKEYGEGLFFIGLNQRKNGWTPFRKQEVRQAFAHLIDPRTVVEEIQNGYATPAYTFHPQWGPYYDDDAVQEFNGGPSEARSLLESALSDTDYGYEGDRLVDGDGNQVELKLVQRAGTETSELAASYMKSQLGKVGIEVASEAVEFRAMLQKYLATTQGDGQWESGGGTFNAGPRDEAWSQNAWDMEIGVGFGAIPYSPWQGDGYFAKTGSFNFGGYEPSAPLGEKFQEASRVASDEERQSILTDIWGILSEEQPLLWLYTEQELAGYQGDIGNVPTVDSFFTEWQWESTYFK